MVPRYGMKNQISKLNSLLRGMCHTYKFDYICNNNIYYNNHISYDGVHLNHDGVWELENNYSYYLDGLNLGNKE